MMAVSRALCLATGGQHPSGQSASYDFKRFDYSAVAPAYAIIKGVRERPVAMFLPERVSGTMLLGDVGIGAQSRPFGEEKISISENLYLFRKYEKNQIISDFLKKMEFQKKK
jgi:hypothetical protein